MTEPNTQPDLYDDASEEFAGKDDLKDRLVAIWVTGKQGTRLGSDGTPYPYVETLTMVLDDGPNGETFTDLVPQAPQRLEDFQHSTTGLVSRLKPRITLKDANGDPVYKPLVGRVNSRKNKTKGFSDSWSIAAPTEDDRLILAPFEDMIRSTTAEMKATRETTDAGAAFE